MKYLDFTSLLAGDPSQIAFLSTFQFDPDFFERRLLRCPALAKARRIVVFLDARQWFKLLRRDVQARWLNRRYLVIPVIRDVGAFHPKLSLLLNETGGQVLCGSNNLTRSGCASNLELLNSLPFEYSGEYQEEINVAREAFGFFQQAATNSDPEISRVATEWIDDTLSTHAWLQAPIEENHRRFRLIHTYDGPIWDTMAEQIDEDNPKEFFVASPFHDADGAICRRLSKGWPHARIELLVQQGYTNLITKPLIKLRNVRLSEVGDFSRRIHAKLLAWHGANASGCLVGSANFTTAAHDGRNVEACLLISEAEDLIEALFDRQLSKHDLAFEDFVPGDAEPPEPNEPLPLFRINSALLTDANQLRLSYSQQLNPPPDSLRLTIRSPAEKEPRTSITIPKNPKATEVLTLSENVLADSHGTLLASLLADVDGEKIESLPVWIIQESRLTFEPGEGSSSSKSNIQDSGEGLPEYLDEIAGRGGAAAIIDYLRRLNIRFQGGSGGGLGPRKFRVKMRDPFQTDAAPEWLIHAKGRFDDLEEAIYEFVDRHEKQRLLKHATLGNINGMENFLDIFTTLVRLLYVYYKRNVVKKGKLIARICTYLELATVGRATEKEEFDGYLYSTYDSLGGDVELLQRVCNDTDYLAEVRAALLIVQSVRFEPNEKSVYGPTATRPRDVLRQYAKAVDEAIAECDLDEPKPAAVRKAFEAYRMFSDAELKQLLAELPD